jgi:hypothetical protein
MKHLLTFLLFIIIFCGLSSFAQESLINVKPAVDTAKNETFDPRKLNDLQKLGFKGKIKTIIESRKKNENTGFYQWDYIEKVIITNFDQDGYIIDRLEDGELTEYYYDEKHNLVLEGKNIYVYSILGDTLCRNTIVGESITETLIENYYKRDTNYILQTVLYTNWRQLNRSYMIKAKTQNRKKYYYNEKGQLVHLDGAMYGLSPGVPQAIIDKTNPPLPLLYYYDYFYTYNQYGYVELEKDGSYVTGYLYRYDERGNKITELKHSLKSFSGNDKKDLAKIYNKLRFEKKPDIINYTIEYFQ